MENEKIQWHPAFDAALQIELAEDAEHLIFETEHLLGKKPMQMDELIIKKNTKKKIRKKLGHIFLGHNIIEYKSPDDYLSVNDFYKVYGYACFYQSDTEMVRKIDPADITITFVCNHYPRQMLKHLCDFRNISIQKYAPGIYHLIGDSFPMQLVITHELSNEEYYWLHYLRNDLKAGAEIEDLAKHYFPNQNSTLYQAVMNVIVRGNIKEMEVDRHMCEALYELFEIKMEQLGKQWRKEAREEGIETGREAGRKEAREEMVKCLVETCEELGVSIPETTKRLVEKLSISKENAEEYIKKYWKACV